MRVIKRSLGGNQRCAVTERTQDPDGFIATGKILGGWDNEVFISMSAARAIGKLAGMEPREKFAELERRLAKLTQDYADLRAYAQAAEKADEAREKVTA